MSKLLAFLFTILLLSSPPILFAADPDCPLSEDHYDSQRAYNVTGACNPGDCKKSETLQDFNGTTCWPQIIQCNFKFNISPNNPEINQEVKLTALSLDGSYSFTLEDREHSEKKGPFKALPGQDEVSLGQFSQEAHWAIVANKDTTSGEQLCEKNYSFLVTDPVGTCEWDTGPPLQVKNSTCKNGTTPHKEGSALTPVCVCKAAGGSDEIPASLVTTNPRYASSAPTVKACKFVDDPSFIKDGSNKDSICIKAGGESCSPTTGDKGTGGIMTAIGCVPTQPQEFVTAVLRVATFASGGIALLIMIFGSFKMIMALGNPEAIKAGRDQFNAAIFGLLFIIFAVLLLEVIGVDILNLPGFGK